MSKPRIRVWSSGLQMDDVVNGTMGRASIGAGYALGECARDMDFEYATQAERDAEFNRVQPILEAIGGIRLEKR